MRLSGTIIRSIGVANIHKTSMDHPVKLCVTAEGSVNRLQAVNKCLIDKEVQYTQTGVCLRRKQLGFGIKPRDILKACWNLVDKFDLGIRMGFRNKILNRKEIFTLNFLNSRGRVVSTPVRDLSKAWHLISGFSLSCTNCASGINPCIRSGHG